MAGRCEICEGLSGARVQGRLQRFLLENRVLSLCADHAAKLREARPETLAVAAALFREPTGRRSLLARRAPLDRRQFPMRPEGRRRSDGRRGTDQG
jgi:hypothetical protein